jgi:hypothetical protein
LRAFHDFSHVGFGCGAGFLDGLGDEFRDLRFAQGGGEVFGKDGYLGLFGFGELRAVGFFKLFDGILALFDLLANY